jgi:hypothetical protein
MLQNLWYTINNHCVFCSVVFRKACARNCHYFWMCNYILLILLIKEKKLLKDAELIWDNPILMVPLAVVSTENGQKRRVNEQTVLSVFGILLGNTIYKWGTDGIKGVRLSWVTIEKAHMQLTFGDGTKTVRIRLLHGMLLAVEINNEGQISLHDDYDRNLYIDGDIWNSTVDVKITRETDDQGGREPVAGVLTNIYYYWGRQSSNNNKPYCIFRPTEDWVETGPDGIATFTIGSGGFIIECEIGVSGPALYGVLVKGLGQDSLWQYYTYPDLKDFEGIIEVKVVNTAGEPLEGRTVVERLTGGVHLCNFKYLLAGGFFIPDPDFKAFSLMAQKSPKIFVYIEGFTRTVWKYMLN